MKKTKVNQRDISNKFYHNFKISNYKTITT